jgi:hypothetical protein
VCSYNELVKEYCNPEFRTVISAKCIEEVYFETVKDTAASSVSFETAVSFTFAVSYIIVCVLAVRSAVLYFCLSHLHARREAPCYYMLYFSHTTCTAYIVLIYVLINS